MEISKLAINKKITAFFADGSQKMNLGIATVIGLLHGKERVPVDVAPLARAPPLLTDLAESAGRIVEQAEEGVFLVQSAEPVVEPLTEVVAQSAAGAIAEPVEEIAQSEPEVSVQPVKPVIERPRTRKYATLSRTFFNGSLRGQILSIYKTRESNPQKTADFKAALVAGDITWDDTPLPKALVEKARL